MDSFHSDLKPENIFYTAYIEICRHMTCIPSRIVKPAQLEDETELEFVGDRLKSNDWIPVLIALRRDRSLCTVRIKSKLKNCPFLHEIDTLEKAKHVRRPFTSLWTDFIFSQLTKSTAILLRNSKVLTILELNGLPMFLEYLHHILRALKYNKTIKHISLANCPIKDDGCEMVCEYLQNACNVETINLSGCQLSAKSGQFLAKLIQNQQINRYCGYWYKLSKEDPERTYVCGIRRITLNRNPNFLNKGFKFILDELEQDLWIKALDLQDCGINEKLSTKIIEIIYYNKSLEIVDLRKNLLSQSTIHKVLQLLACNVAFQPEFQVCNIDSNVSSDSNDAFKSNNSLALSIHETKSLTIKNKDSSSTNTRLKLAGKKLRKSNNLNQNKYVNSKITLTQIQIKKLLEKKNNELLQKINQIQASKNQILIDFKKLPPLQRIPIKQTLKTIINDSGDTSFKINKMEMESKTEKMEYSEKESEDEITAPCSTTTSSDYTKSSSQQSKASKILERMINNDDILDNTSFEFEDLIDYVSTDQSEIKEKDDTQE